MAAIIKGTGVIWSVGALTFTAGIVSTSGTGHFSQSAEVTRGSEKTYVKDNGGTIKAAIFHGFLKSFRITVIPTGSSIANARTSGDAWLPQAGTLITMTDDSGTTIDATYNCISAKQSRTVDGVATVDIELETSDESADITTVIS